MISRNAGEASGIAGPEVCNSRLAKVACIRPVLMKRQATKSVHMPGHKTCAPVIVDVSLRKMARLTAGVSAAGSKPLIT